ncbi:hypothetical protein QI155_10640 [Thermodesulfovibrio sp. 1176]|uniref:hypothetical protein n=1 Tax=Thermodesulfovibrio sp. 1176 TaxID=3043424 RepID=UPI002482EE95|nr:hypothetical protein [Thermodesulfovibrio sp. 1176]MDI1472989.1 hypothetical protein [Thermodesulfovibrio sp. 1176]
MGWIRIKSGKDKLLLNSSMQYFACINEDKKIKVLEVEKIFEVVKAQGREIDREEFDRLQKSQREQNKRWWNHNRKFYQKQ